MSPQSAASSRAILRKLDRGIRLGAARAWAEHKKAGHSVYIWENGRIVRIKPEDIHVVEEKKR